MDPRDLQTAAELCQLVETPHLLEYLGLQPTASPADAQAALEDKRRRLQAMQNNPKFRASALFLIKNHKTLARVLDDPQDYLEQVRRAQEAEKLPVIEIAIGAILADGVVSVREEAYVREQAVAIGISDETYRRVLRQRADQAGIPLPQAGAPDGPPVEGGVRVGDGGGDGPKLQGAAGHGWWDATFTRMLLDAIPGGPGELVDIYCRTALSALTLLPQRRQLTYLGIDRSKERLEQAREELGREALYDVGARITLAPGQPNALPIPDESVDFVLAIRALANLPETLSVFIEAMRVLRPGGRLIVAEPDGLGESFYFDEHLTRYNAAFQALLARVDAAQGLGTHPMGRPGLALGPQLPARMAHLGFGVHSIDVHPSNNVKMRRFGPLARRLRGYPMALVRAVGLSDSAPEMLAVHGAVDELEGRIRGETRGLGGHVLPLFLCVGIKA